MITVLVALTLCADWSPRLAADYLDARQQAWFAWKAAQTPGGPCVSCHTGTTYLLARPELRRKLGESEPTKYETGLKDALRARIPLKDVFPASFAKEPKHSQSLGVEAIQAAFLLRDQAAMDRMWSLQITEGKDKGAWNWFHLDLDPWEMPESTFYGAAMAAIAAGDAPQSEQKKLLSDYLRREQEGQPLHNRLMLLWASVKMPEVLLDKEALIDQIRGLQNADGGWSIESLGPWKKDYKTRESDAYATAFTAYVLKKVGNRPKNALNWLKSHQNSDGSWTSVSMNKEYPPDSMMAKFMQDAATAFAALALLD